MTNHQTPRPMHPAVEAVLATAATVALVIFTIVLIMIIASGTRAGAASLTTQRDAPTTRFYTPDGKSAGTASTYGNTTEILCARRQARRLGHAAGAAMKKPLVLAAVLLAIAGPAHAGAADDYCSNHFCLARPALPPTMYVVPSGTSTLGGPTMADAPSWLRRPQLKTRMRRH